MGDRRHEVAAQVEHVLQLGDERPLELEATEVAEGDAGVRRQRHGEALLFRLETSGLARENGEHADRRLVCRGNRYEEATRALHRLLR